MLATVGNVRIQSPVAQGGVTAVGFHGWTRARSSSSRSARRRTRGCLRGSGAASAARRGAASAGTSSRAASSARSTWAQSQEPTSTRRSTERSWPPRPGRSPDARSALRSSSVRHLRPSLVVSVQNVRPDPALTVGANVAAGSSKLGRVTTSAGTRRRRSTVAPDGGNNVPSRSIPRRRSAFHKLRAACASSSSPMSSARPGGGRSRSDWVHCAPSWPSTPAS